MFKTHFSKVTFLTPPHTKHYSSYFASIDYKISSYILRVFFDPSLHIFSTKTTLLENGRKMTFHFFRIFPYNELWIIFDKNYVRRESINHRSEQAIIYSTTLHLHREMTYQTFENLCLCSKPIFQKSHFWHPFTRSIIHRFLLQSTTKYPRIFYVCFLPPVCKFFSQNQPF